MSTRLPDRALLGLSLLASGGAFAIDLLTPVGMTTGLLYVLVALVVLLMRNRRHPPIVAALCTVLSSIELAFHPGAIDFQIVANHAVTVLAVAIIALAQVQIIKRQVGLEKTDATFRSLIEQLPDSVRVRAGDRTVYANPASARIYGYDDPADMIGHHPYEVYSDEERADLQAREDTFLTGVDTPWRQVRPTRWDGAQMELESAGIHTTWDGEEAILIVNRDVSGRNRAEADLAKSVERFRSMADNIPGMVYERRVGPDGNLLYSFISAGSRELLGLEPEEIIADPAVLTKSIHPDDRAPLLKKLQASTELQAPMDAVFRIYDADNRIRYIRTKSQPRETEDGSIVWDSVALDQTAAAETERALKDQFTQLELVVEATQTGVADWNREDGTFHCSNRFKSMMELQTEEDVVQFDLAVDPTHPDDQRIVQQAFREARDLGRSIDIDFRRRMNDGSWRWFHIRTTSVLNESGDVTRIAGAMADITDSKKAARDLAENEAQLRAITENLPVLISTFDADRNYSFVNKRYEDWFAIPPSALIGKSHRDIRGKFRTLKSDADRDAIINALDRAYQGNITTVEVSRIRHDGREMLIEYSYIPQFDDHGVVESVVALGRDVTESHAMTQALAENEERMRIVIDNIPGLVSYIDQSMTYQLVNRQYETWFGFDRNQIVGASTTEFADRTMPTVNDQEAENRRNNWERALSGEHITFESRRTTVDGRSVYVAGDYLPHFNADGEVLGIVCMMRDVTAHKLSEEALIKSERNYRTLFDVMPDAVYIHKNDRIIFANQAAATLFGYGSPQDMIGGSSLAHFDERHHADIVDNRRVKVDSGEITETIEFDLIRADGSSFEGECVGAPIDWEGDQCTLLINRDITERSRMIAAMSEAKDSAEAANRAKSDFLATMSHEIRTPMNGVLGMASLLLDSKLDTTQRDYAGVIKSSGEALLELLNDILDVSKLEAGRFDIEDVAFDLHDAVDRSAMLLNPRAEEKGLSVIVTIGDDVPDKVKGDPARLRQILLNLIGNAIKFSEDGCIAVQAYSAPTDANRNLIRFEVVDEGIGVSEEQRLKLFERFTQADASMTRRYGGTGLGLAICKELIGKMGGEIGVDSVLGEGSTFWFTLDLPATDDPLKETYDPSSSGETSQPVHALDILAVDDNEVNCVVTKALLLRAGHRVEIARGGREAVNLATERKFDVILMDVQMPEIDGIAATRMIREFGGASADVPVIAVTANAMKGDRERYLDAGMDDYVSKPIDPSELDAALARQCSDARVDDPHTSDTDPVRAKCNDEAVGPGPEEAKPVADPLADLLDDLDSRLGS